MKQQVISKTIERTVLLNPGPATTSSKVKIAQIVADICPREDEFGHLMHEICDGLKQIGKATKTHEVALFVASGTGAMEATLTSAIGKTDRVLILTNGAYGYRMQEICKVYGITHETLFAYGEWPELATIEQALTSGKFTHLAMIHHETSTGMMNPLEQIATLAKRYQVALIVDAMSSFGAYPVDLSLLEIDYMFSSSNKCIHGMAGLSFVLFHKRQLENLRKNSRGYYFDVYSQWQNLQVKNQLRFTPPVQVCYAFKAAIDETLAETVPVRWQRYQANWHVLYDGFRELGFHFYLPDEQQSRILLAVDLTSKTKFNFNHFHDFMQSTGITIYPGVIPETQTFRVAVIGDLYPDDMHFVISTAQDYFKAS